jgi:hypothetical protein
MAADASAYAALGLEPGADDAAVEQAYKRLIKQHHPDRQGGDSSRAAEINRAYRELRVNRDFKTALELHDEEDSRPRSGRVWLVTAVLLVIATIVLLLTQGPLARLTESFAMPAARQAAHGKAAPTKSDVMDQPIHVAEVDAAARDALRLQRSSDEMAMANVSRDCHHLLRNDPSLLHLDRCAAFDDAVVQLQDRDPLRDQGPFSELAVTGRLWSGATALSDDSVAIDGRLDRIRQRVELALAQASQPAVAKPGRN